MKTKDKICGCGCGKSGRLFSKGLIKSCWAKIYQRPIKCLSVKKKGQNEAIKIESVAMKTLFLQIWDKTEDFEGYCYCFETGKKMHLSLYRNNACWYHHVLEKGREKYRKYKMEEWNIVIVLPEVHNQIHSNINKTPRIKLLTEELQEKY